MKRIVICADGTWNQSDQIDKESGKRRPTNVTKIARAVQSVGADGADQVVYYHSGVGTGGPLDQFTGGAFGRGIENNIRALYRFILYNHVPGDELFLFGFSRGAFTVRTLAGFMHRYGLVRKRDDYYVPEMYQCYEKNIAQHTPEWDRIFLNDKGISRIQRTRDCPPIKFIGVWDTVGALGAPGLLGQLFNSARYQYHDVELNPRIEHAVHAVALDERRKPFAPSLWRKPEGWKGTLEQAWFAGVHSNVGGGLKPDGLANVALQWVAGHAQRHGLALDEEYLRYFEPHFDSTLHESMSLMYRLMGPLQRPVGADPAAFETVHRSVLQRRETADSRYGPANLDGYVSGAPGVMAVVDTPPASTAHTADAVITTAGVTSLRA